VLRITRLREDQATCLRLEGKLVGPWVNVAREACEQEASRSRPIALDLSEVTFVDAEGLSLLRALRASGVELRECSNFVAELLRLEKTS